MGGLRNFAQQRGLAVDIRVPERPSVRNPAQMAMPRGSAMGSQRTDFPPVQLVPLEQAQRGPGGAGPGPSGAEKEGKSLKIPGGSPSGGGPAGPVLPTTAGGSTSVARTNVSPYAREAAEEIVKGLRSEAATIRAMKFLGAAMHILQVISTLEMLSDLTGMAERGLTGG